jgi:hypothetical protein
MISQEAIRQAESWCRHRRQIFAKIERQCMTYVRINESVLGPCEHQADADKLFLMLVRTELDHPVEEIYAQHERVAWGSA